MNPKSFRDERPDLYPCGSVISVPTVTGRDKGEGDFGEMLSGLRNRREKICLILFTMQGLVTCAVLPALDCEMDNLRLAKFRSRDRLTLIELHRVFKSKQAEAESSVDVAHRLEEPGHSSEEDLEALLAAGVHVEQLTP